MLYLKEPYILLLHSGQEKLMKYSKFFINSALLFSIFTLPLYPNSEIHSLIHQDTSKQFQRAQTPGQLLTSHHFLSYDEILNLIDSLENGELEKRYSQADLDKLNHFIAHLARQGIITNEVYSLENDTLNVEQINEQGLITLEKILNHPEKQIVCDTLSRYGQVVEFRTPVGGVRHSIDGTFIGFLEP